jgi:type VI secretion system protein ImpC
MRDRLEFDVTVGARSRPRDDGEPMRLLLIGDFSGAPPAERPPLASRPAQQVDLDTFEAVMKRLAPRADVGGRQLTFRTLDDFHPDRLIRHESFAALLEQKRQPPEGDDAFARLLGTSVPADPPRESSPTSSGNRLDAYIRELVAPHIVARESPRDRAHQQAADAAVADEMRAVLHAPEFQAREAAWRGVHWLTTSLELDEHLQLHLFDASREELLADIVSAGGRLADTSLRAALVDRWRHVPGSDGWSALVALLRFGTSDTDIGLLAGLGLIASEAEAPLLADADVSVIAAHQDAASSWSRLRRSEVARWIGVSAPRVLLRAPYGPRGDSIASFPFDERSGEAGHEQLLWGHASLGLALLLGRAFTAHGWEMQPGDERELSDLPAYTYEEDGEPVMQAAAERFLTERQVHEWLDAGVIPIVSRRDRHAAIVVRFQSIADPPSALPW